MTGNGIDTIRSCCRQIEAILSFKDVQEVVLMKKLDCYPYRKVKKR